MRERPVHHRPRRRSHWLNPTEERKVHSLVDKVYKRKNLELAWKKVKQGRGAGGVDGETLATFEASLEANLERMHQEHKDGTYTPQPIRAHRIPKAGQPGAYRTLGIPTIYDRVVQQAILNRLEPIFESVYGAASFGYRKGRSTWDALRKVWRELNAGSRWVVDADLRDFFGSVDQDKRMALVQQRVSDGRILGLLKQMLKAGCVVEGKRVATTHGTPQGGVLSLLLRTIVLTPFDREMRYRGYQLTHYADDWVVTCSSASEARAALAVAEKLLKTLGVTLNLKKTRIVHIKYGFEYLGYKIKRGSQGVNRLGSESSGVSSRRWRESPFIRQSSSFPGDFSECEMHDPPGEPGARKSHAGLCVQSRQACSAGVSPARVEIRAL